MPLILFDFTFSFMGVPIGEPSAPVLSYSMTVRAPTLSAAKAELFSKHSRVLGLMLVQYNIVEEA